MLFKIKQAVKSFALFLLRISRKLKLFKNLQFLNYSTDITYTSQVTFLSPHQLLYLSRFALQPFCTTEVANVRHNISKLFTAKDQKLIASRKSLTRREHQRSNLLNRIGSLIELFYQSRPKRTPVFRHFIFFPSC